MNRALWMVPAALLVLASPLAAAPAVSAPTAPQAPCERPSDVLDLANWKLTLPTGSDEEPTEITQPELAEFAEDPWFVPTEACDGVRFRAAVNGVTTGGSSYPRSELREMTDGGADEASWSAGEGTHTMVLDAAITQVPAEKPEVVAGQIHGGDDDETTFRLQGNELYLTDGDTSDYQLITDDYQLGTRFEAKFVASGGQAEAFFNGESVGTVEIDSDTNYFKAGAYTQANCERSAPCEDGNYGEVEVYGVSVSHE